MRKKWLISRGDLKGNFVLYWQLDGSSISIVNFIDFFRWQLDGGRCSTLLLSLLFFFSWHFLHTPYVLKCALASSFMSLLLLFIKLIFMCLLNYIYIYIGRFPVVFTWFLYERLFVLGCLFSWSQFFSIFCSCELFFLLFLSRCSTCYIFKGWNESC